MNIFSMRIQLILFLSIVFIASASVFAAAIPSAVATFSERVEMCLHWAGESGDTPPERTAEIEQATQQLHCDKLKVDAQNLAEQYRLNSSAWEALQKADNAWWGGMGEKLLVEPPFQCQAAAQCTIVQGNCGVEWAVNKKFTGSIRKNPPRKDAPCRKPLESHPANTFAICVEGQCQLYPPGTYAGGTPIGGDACLIASCWGHLDCSYLTCTRKDGSTYTQYAQ